MILYDLFYNGKSDSAATGCRISRSICPVEPVKNIWQIFLGDSPSIVFDFYLNKIPDILNPDVDEFFRFIHIFYGISYNIIDYSAQLLRICNNLGIRCCIIKIGQGNPLCLQIQSDFFHTILKICGNVQLCKIIWNTVGVDLGIQCQFIDQCIHLICFVVNGTDILI